MPHYLLLLSFMIGLFINCFTANAEPLSQSTQQYDVQTLSLRNGLVQSSVRSLIQDRQGLIWLGTQSGVQTFDGLHLKRLDQLLANNPIDTSTNNSTNTNTNASTNVINNIRVTHMLETQDGHILLATFRHGLFLYNQQQRTLQQFNANGFDPKMSDKTPFYQVCQDQDKQVWAATHQGLFQVDLIKGSWQIIIGGPDNGRFIDVVCIDDNIIAHRDNALVKYNKSSKKTRVLTINSSHVNFYSLSIKKVNPQYTLVGKHDGLFRLAADFSKLEKIWPQQSNVNNNQTDQSQATVNDMLLHNNNAVWLGTKHLGLVLVELSTGKELRRVQSIPGGEYSLSGNHITHLMQDQSNMLWVSVHGIGVDRLSMDQLAMKTWYNHGKNALNNNNITAITKAPDGNLWFATNRIGMKQINPDNHSSSRFDQQVIAAYQQHVPDKLPFISDMVIDSSNRNGSDNNRLWFTTDEGIIRLKLSNTSNTITSNTISNDSRIYRKHDNNPQGPRTRGRDIFIAQDNNLYITDLGAILRYDSHQETFNRLPLSDNNLPDSKERLRLIRQHKNGTLFVLGIHNIYRLGKDDLLQPLLDANQLKQLFDGTLGAFAITTEGNFYIAAYGALLFVDISQADKPQISRYSGKSLPNNDFYAIELDNAGNPWLSTNNGITRFNAQDQQFDHFSLSDGVLVREFNALASFKQDNGDILFGGIDGWSQISPQKLLHKNHSPAITLSSYQIGSLDTQQYLPEGGIEMAFSDHWLQFSFSAMDYHSPQENQYAYFLQGFDPDWRNFGNKSSISYTGLPPGNYTLHAKAATKQGDWHQQVLTIPITVQPPFYRSIIAWGIYAVLVILITAIIMWRRYKLAEERAHYIEQVELSRERMKLALWGSDSSLWDWHILHNEIYRSSLHFLGYGDDKIATTMDEFKSLVHPDDLAMFESEVEEVLLGHTAEYSAQYRLKDSNDNWHWISDQGKVVDRAPNHKPVRLSGTLRDISLLKQHETELENLNHELEDKIKLRTQEFADQNTQLSSTLGTLKNAQKQLVESEKMASLGNLVAGISHEINTPVGVALTAATNSTDIIRRLQGLFYDRNLTVNAMKKGLQQLMSSNDLVESSIDRTAHLIQTFKQLAVDHNQHEWRIIELPIYLIEMAPTFNSLISHTRHSITVVDNDFFDVECAPGDLYQIVSQLVNNSLAHGFADDIEEGFAKNKKGQIIIETLQKDDHWVLRYSDNGCGLDSEALEQIFDPFYTTKRGEGFAGLGLHLVYNVVNQSLGGSIECISEKGQGLTFIFKLPLGNVGLVG